jgi:hypothetical protein
VGAVEAAVVAADVAAALVDGDVVVPPQATTIRTIAMMAAKVLRGMGTRISFSSSSSHGAGRPLSAPGKRQPNTPQFLQ